MMDYPRAFFVFDKQNKLPSAEFFQNISSSDCEVYIPYVSKHIDELDLQIVIIEEVNSYFGIKLTYVQKEIIVISNPKTLDLLMAYFSDKNFEYGFEYFRKLEEAEKLAKKKWKQYKKQKLI